MISAIILAGGGSSRLKREKGLAILCGRPLVQHVIHRIEGLADEIIIVVGSEDQKERFADILEESVEIVVDLYNDEAPLVGALTGLTYARGEYALMMACDMPFVSRNAFKMLLKEADGYNGAVFQYPNGWIEPLHAVYRVKPSLQSAKRFYETGELRIRMILKETPMVVNVPVIKLRSEDPNLVSFYDADTEEALKKAEMMLKDRFPIPKGSNNKYDHHE